MVGDKRSAADFVGEQSELRPKRVKMRDLESVFRSEGESPFSHFMNFSLFSFLGVFWLCFVVPLPE